MYSVKKDTKDNKLVITYFLPDNKSKRVYRIENADWSFTQKLLGQFVKDHEDLEWISGMISLLNRVVEVEDNGEWRVL